MTDEEIFKERREAHRMFLKHFDRRQLLALRQDIEDAIGYRELVGYFLLHGIDIKGK